MKDATNRALDLLIKLARGKLRGARLAEAKAIAKSHPKWAKEAAVAARLDDEKQAHTHRRIDREALRQLSRRMFLDYQQNEAEPGARIGVTVYDSKVLPLPDGVRPAAIDVRKLKYRIGSWNVELAFYPVTVDSFELMGQITGLEAGHEIEVILRKGRRKYEANADEHYLFRFARVPATDYQLLILEDGEQLGRIDLQS